MKYCFLWQEERDRRREDIVKEEVAALASENHHLRKTDSKVRLEIEEVPTALGATQEGNLVALRNEIKTMQQADSVKVPH